MRRHIFALVALLSGLALAAPQPPEVAVADVRAVKDKLTVWSDGKKHFIAMVMTRKTDSPIFWSNDGQSFYALRVRGGGSDGDDADLKRLDRNFWEPRLRGAEASLGYLAETNKLIVQCAERNTPMDKLGVVEAKPLVDRARFYQPRWGRYPYALARNDSGRYYYVDNLREPEHAKSFRLFAGPRGAMKVMKMLNVVSDSQGDIFSTAHGDLRLILSKQDSTWIANKKPTKLLWIPVDDEWVMIYNELGVYTGQPLGTPCDDL